MAQRSLYDISIAGMRLRVRSSLSEEKVNQLIELVDTRVKSALKKSNSKNLQKALLLAALNIAEELVDLKGQVRKELDTLEGRARDVLSELESAGIDRIGVGV